MGLREWNQFHQQADTLDEKKRKTAVALSYDPKDEAPKIIASGRGVIADRMIERAKENDVPVHQDEKLANTLSKLDIGDYIPEELYEVVAEVLLFVDKMDNLKGKVMGEK
ncbi:MAG: EscU/YscU/HrcU family type III secretion system export apparatus switch protein [Clostridiales bacterium]|nr:EscU/YscU/HrcU family type III secretion system export apparatus switch protein [Clostridiales bacterium]